MAELRLRKPLENRLLTVEVRIAREFYVRMWVGKWLFMCAAWVLGASIEFRESTEPTTPSTSPSSDACDELGLTLHGVCPRCSRTSHLYASPSFAQKVCPSCCDELARQGRGVQTPRHEA